LLAEYQARVMRICFAAEVSSVDVEALGNRERWLLYRQMVRSRIRRVIGNAFPGFLAALGEDRATSYLETWLDQAPPRSRYFREGPSEFFDFVQGDEFPLQRPEGATQELGALEHARWSRRFALPALPPNAGELSFESPLQLNPTALFMQAEHAIHQKVPADRCHVKKTTFLCIYRHFDSHKVHTRELNEVAYRLLRQWENPDITITEGVQAARAEVGFAIDASFIERLSSMLAAFVEDGLILGARLSSPQTSR